MKQGLQRWTILSILSALVACSNTGGARPDDALQNTEAAEINTRLGLSYLQRGDYVTALEKLQKALKQDPKLPSAHNTIALLYQHLGENDKAQKHFEQAIKKAPEYAEAQNNFGVFLCQQGQYTDAESRFLKTLEAPLYQSKAAALENAGLCVQRIPEPQKAESYFRQALQIEPKLTKSLLQMSKISYEQQNYLQARHYIQRYQQAVITSTAEALLLGIKIENKLGDQDAVDGYSLSLRSRFPDSDEIRIFNQGLINE